LRAPCVRKSLAILNSYRDKLRNYIGEEPNKCKHCSHCSKSFFWSGVLPIHSRFHTREKPFATLFAKLFANLEMQQYVKICSWKPFSCSCTKSFILL